jgi:hypothetical protein
LSRRLAAPGGEPRRPKRIGGRSAGGSLIRNDNPEQDRANEVKPMRYVYPLDPECPVVAEFMETLFGDPTTMAMGAPVDDITEEFERRHRKQCKRCQEYGVRQRVTE